MVAGLLYNIVKLRKDFILFSKTFFKSYGGVFIFSILKYLEIILTALTTFFLAKKIGPQQLGQAVPVFLYITYANYLALGLNQVITKNYSRIEQERKVAFVTINLQYILLTTVLNFLLAWLFLESSYFLYAAFISILTITRGFYYAYFRAINRIRVLNINSIIYSTLLFLGVVFFVEFLDAYLALWMLMLFIANILLLFFDIQFFKKVFSNILSVPTKQSLKNNISEGIKLALTGLSTTFFLTYDRLIINNMNIATPLKGSVQLADYVGMAIYMISTTIIFYYYPHWIKKIREDQDFARRFSKTSIKIILAIPILLAMVYLCGLFLVPFFFAEYPNLLNIIVLIIASKLGVISLSFISLFYVGKDKEKEYLRWVIFPIAVLLVVGIMLVISHHNNYILVPVLNTIVLVITAAMLQVRIRKYVKRKE